MRSPSLNTRSPLLCPEKSYSAVTHIWVDGIRGGGGGGFFFAAMTDDVVAVVTAEEMDVEEGWRSRVK